MRRSLSAKSLPPKGGVGAGEGEGKDAEVVGSAKVTEI